jgi:DMSO/TMAO reductase YedYZ molybdopterin-dependent catalytic subunit
MTTLLPRRTVLSAALMAWAIAPRVAFAADDLVITGDVKRTLSLDVAALRAFPAAAQTTFRSTREVAGQPQPATELRGVRLLALLEHAALAEQDRLDWRKAVVVAIARDGYRAVFSWPELANTPGGGQVLVAHERDGTPLGPHEGPLALHAPSDTRTGPRHVKWLSRIEVRILRD